MLWLREREGKITCGPIGCYARQPHGGVYRPKSDDGFSVRKHPSLAQKREIEEGLLLVAYLGEKSPLLGSPSTPKGPEEYMLLRRKSWSIAGDDAARLCEGLPDPWTRRFPNQSEDKAQDMPE